MSNSTVQILARVLRVLLIFALLLNVLALLLVPASVMVNAENLFGGAGTFLHDLFHPEADDVTAAGVSAIFLSWVWIWGEGANALIALFLVICGICTALILLQGLRVLGTILQGPQPTVLRHTLRPLDGPYHPLGAAGPAGRHPPDPAAGPV